MGQASKNVLLTGPPGCGKTTVIHRLIERLGDLRLAGLSTQEIRERGSGSASRPFPCLAGGRSSPTSGRGPGTGLAATASSPSTCNRWCGSWPGRERWMLT